MNKINQIKQIAKELGIIFVDESTYNKCEIRISSSYYAPHDDYVIDPSVVYIFEYNKKNKIISKMCFTKLEIDEESDKLVWVGEDGFDSVGCDINCNEIKNTLINCIKQLKDKEQELKMRNLQKDFK